MKLLIFFGLTLLSMLMWEDRFKSQRPSQSNFEIAENPTANLHGITKVVSLAETLKALLNNEQLALRRLEELNRCLSL